MSLRDLHDTQGDGIALPVEQTRFSDFSQLPAAHQETLISQLSKLPGNRLAQIPELDQYLRWITSNSQKSRHILKTIGKNLEAQYDPLALSGHPQVGQVLSTLMWNGNKRRVRRILKAMLSQPDTIMLSSNPDLPTVIHMAKLTNLKNRLVVYGMKLLTGGDKKALKTNPSKDNVFGEFAFAGVNGFQHHFEAGDHPNAERVEVDLPLEIDGVAAVREPNRPESPGLLGFSRLGNEATGHGLGASRPRVGLGHDFGPMFGPQKP